MWELEAEALFACSILIHLLHKFRKQRALTRQGMRVSGTEHFKLKPGATLPDGPLFCLLVSLILSYQEMD